MDGRTVKTALFTNIAHPIHKIATVGEVCSIRIVAWRRHILDLPFLHVEEKIFSAHTETFINWSLDRGRKLGHVNVNDHQLSRIQKRNISRNVTCDVSRYKKSWDRLYTYTDPRKTCSWIFAWFFTSKRQPRTMVSSTTHLYAVRFWFYDLLYAFHRNSLRRLYRSWHAFPWL